MIQNLPTYFDPKKDIQEVDQFGYIDLVDVIKNGSIDCEISVKEPAFNQIGDPSSILGKPKDVFDAHRMSAEVQNNAAKVAADSKPAGAGAQSSETASQE